MEFGLLSESLEGAQYELPTNIVNDQVYISFQYEIEICYLEMWVYPSLPLLSVWWNRDLLCIFAYQYSATLGQELLAMLYKAALLYSESDQWFI